MLCAQSDDRRALIQEIVNRSRLLEDAYFRLPRSVWKQFVLDQAAAEGKAAQSPVPCIRSQGVYRLKIAGDGAASLDVEIHLHVLDPRAAGAVAVLTDSLAWSQIQLSVGGEGAKPFEPVTRGKWLVCSPKQPGRHVIRASSELKGFKASGGSFALPIIRTVQTTFMLDSPHPFEVTAAGASRTAAGDAAKGTHVALPLKPAARIEVSCRPPRARSDRRARYKVSGAVAWNFGPAAQQVSADLRIAILGGKTDRIEIALPAAADRVAITGPDVRETRTGGGAASVFLRGSITGKTRLKLSYELPAARAAGSLARPEIRGGRWSGGTLVITNTAGGSELQPARTPGLREIALVDIPRGASAILAGKAVLAYSITSPNWSAEIESMDLSEFAIRQTIADTARYQFVYRPHGVVVCRADYEIRNRNRQFLEVKLPAGAKVLLARVSEKSRPLTPAKGQKGAYLLPLERSTASVMGLVSFPVQVVYMYRTDALKSGGKAAVALPRIDIPIAYAWCQANMPDGLRRVKFSGVMRPVDQYSSETAVASMTYGSATALDPERKRLETPEVTAVPRSGKIGLLGWLFDSPPELRLHKSKGTGAKVRTADARPDGPDKSQPTARPTNNGAVTPKSPSKISRLIPGRVLTRNYWRAGKESYDRGRYDEAHKSLSKVLELSPKSPDAANAQRLIANIKLLKGKLHVKSRAEKVAAATVKQKISAANIKELSRQRELLEEGLQASRQKDTRRAQTLFRAAEALGKKLVARGESTVEQDARLREARKQLDFARKTSGEQLGKGLKQIKQLRKSGRTDEAVVLAEKLAEEANELPGNSGSVIVRELQKEREQLAIASARAALDRTDNRSTWGRWQQQDQGQGQARQEGEKRRQATTHLARGKKLLDSGDASGAIGEFQTAVALDPTLADAKRLLALARKLAGSLRGGTLDKLVDRRTVSRGGVRMQFNKAMDRSKKILAGANSPSDFTAAAQAAGTAVNAIDAARNLLGADEYGAMRDAAVRQHKWVDANKTKWEKDAAALNLRKMQKSGADSTDRRSIYREFKQIQADKMRLIRQEGPRGFFDPGTGEGRPDFDMDGQRRPTAKTIGERFLDDVQADFVRSATGTVVQVYKVGDLVTALSDDEDRDGPEDIAGNEAARGKRTSRLTEQVKSLLKDSNKGNVQITTYNGQRAFVVTAGTGEQEAVSQLIEGLRKARGPQIQVGGSNIAFQKALKQRPDGGFSYGLHRRPAGSNAPDIITETVTGGTVLVGGGVSADRRYVTMNIRPQISTTDWTIDGKESGGIKIAPDLQSFIDKNYSWQGRRSKSVRTVLTLKNAQATSVAAALTQMFTPQQGVRVTPDDLVTVVAEGSSNSIIVAANPKNLDLVKTMLAELDQASVMAAHRVLIVPLKNVDAATVASIISKMYKQQVTAARRDNRSVDPLEVSADKRNNALILTASKEMRTQVLAWVQQLENMKPSRGTLDKTMAVTAGDKLDVAELARRLRFNRGQKTQVSSLNINVDTAAANSLGIKFHKGNNDVSFTVVDEAQFRTLMELDAAIRGAVNDDRVDPNETRQDTIVGTDALLANSMTTNVIYSHDRGNKLDIADNPISLSHEKYVLIDNNGYLTAVRAGEMQHWQEASKRIEFVQAPQTIEIPRVGELVKLEKTLVKPSDEMVVRFDYQWKGR